MRDLAQRVLASKQAEEAAYYGVTPAELVSFGQRVDSYASAIAAPQQRIAERKSRTAQLPERFSEISEQFEVLDKLVLSFRRTAAGRDFVGAYQASRNVRDLGRRGSNSAAAKSEQQSEAVTSQ